MCARPQRCGVLKSVQSSEHAKPIAEQLEIAIISLEETRAEEEAKAKIAVSGEHREKHERK